MRLCFATRNQHKLEEVKSLLVGTFTLMNLNDIGCHEELPETTGSIHGNSKQKAEYVNKKFMVDCFADDSGLEVTALNKAPGVDSAIYAGYQRCHGDNMNLLLKNLYEISQREAQFITVITLIVAQRAFQFEGILKGTIAREASGHGGFGYDPVFVPEGMTKTLAELTLEEKNSISHRALAVKQLVKFLGSEFYT